MVATYVIENRSGVLRKRAFPFEKKNGRSRQDRRCTHEFLANNDEVAETSIFHLELRFNGITLACWEVEVQDKVPKTVDVSFFGQDRICEGS